jgi:hypothetical protein
MEIKHKPNTQDWVEEIFLDLEIIKDLNPLENSTWAEVVSPITKQEIKEAIDNNKLLNISYKYGTCWGRENHIERIAYLVVNKSNVPIDVDVGVPGFCEVTYIIQDGYHRLAAAYYRGDKTILATISGAVKYAKHILNI